jgi:hypothetical protein
MKCLAAFSTLAAMLVIYQPAAAAPAIGPVATSTASVPCFECLELTFPIDGRYDNPFDDRQIDVSGEFRAPDGKPHRTSGFLYQPFQRELCKGRETIQPAGDRVWKVRFAPTLPGQWSARIVARDGTGTATTAWQQFTATPGTGHGYIRRSGDRRYFQYDDGTPFFGVGENVAWGHQRGTFDYDDWLPAGARAGMNLARIWLQWNQVLSIEHKETGAGRYDLGNAWRVDYVLDLARRHGVRVLFTCDSPEPYQKLHVWEGHKSYPWQNCPHNAANGGPLREPQEFYTTEEGHRLIRQRLRYIVARWGWDPNVFCWELWNEMSCFPNWQKLMPQTVAWHREMAAHVRQLDPNRHLVTTSFGSCGFASGTDDIWRLDDLDFVQTHIYGTYAGGLKDTAGSLLRVQRAMAERYRRPHIFGEFGCHVAFSGERLKWDSQALYLHNGLWASALGGSAATALTWYWEFVHTTNQYHHFTPVARFCQDVPWPTAGLRDAQATFRWTTAPTLKPEDLTIEPEYQWDIPEDRFVVEHSGQVRGKVAVPSGLHGSNHAKRRRPITLVVDYRQPGKLIVHVNRVEALGILELRLDGKVALRQELPAGPGTGPWKSSRLVEGDGWKSWQAVYDRDYAIDVPQGKHEIRLDNLGKDMIEMARITLTGYQEQTDPPLRAAGLVGGRLGLVWIQNTTHTWNRLQEGRPVQPAEHTELVLSDVPNGPCQIEWWDTWKGTVTRQTQAQVDQGRLVVPLPHITTDLALKLRFGK